jgi:hypothetical protein
MSIANDIWGTQYPYLQARHTTFNNLMTSYKRSVAEYNPFAYQQIPSQ